MSELNASPIFAHKFPATPAGTLSLDQFNDQMIILYFYPKDSTPGCTIESKDFRDHYPQFLTANAQVIGVSRDTMRSHERFTEKHQLPFPLIADTDEKLCQFFDVIKEKNLFGKKVRGIQRSTFILAPTGEVLHSWRKVKINGHVNEVLAAIT